MAFDEDYRDLIVTARDALLALLEESSVDSWIGLRRNYTDLRRVLERDDQERERQEGIDDDWKRRRDAEGAWKRCSRQAREGLVLQALGEDRLSLTALTDGVNEELGHVDPYAVYDSHVRHVVKGMLSTGQLDRVVDPAFSGKLRYLYFRKRALEGPIVELEQAYHDGEAVS